MHYQSEAAGHERCPRCGARFRRGEKHRCRSAGDQGEAAQENPGKSPPTKDAIRQRAHELYVARGRTDGQDVGDWLQAERELCAGGARQPR